MSGAGSLARFAESATLKLLQFVVMVVAVPLIGYGLNSVMQRIESMEKSIQVFTTQSATNELRVQSLEREVARISSDLRIAQDSVLKLDYELRRIDDRARGPK